MDNVTKLLTNLVPRKTRPQYKTAQEIRDAAQLYFDACKADKAPYTMTGLAMALGFSRATFCRYGQTAPFGEVIADLRQVVENQLENRVLTSTNPGGAKFVLNVNCGWQESHKVDQAIEGGITLGWASGDSGAKRVSGDDGTGAIEGGIDLLPEFIDV